LEIELEPREASRSGRELEDYKASQAKARAKAAEQEEQRALEQARAAEQDKETAQEYARGVLDRIDQEEAAHSDMLSKMWQQKKRLETEIEGLKADYMALQYSQWMSREPDIFEAVQRVAAQRRERGLDAPGWDDMDIGGER
jgi:rubrerythrin